MTPLRQYGEGGRDGNDARLLPCLHVSAPGLLLRLARIILTVWAAATLVFFALRAAGDPVAALVPPDLPDAIAAEYRARLGLDRPPAEQYVRYLAALAQGDFGLSFRTGGPAWDLVAERLPATLLLTSASLVPAVVVGVPAGIMAALRRTAPWTASS